VGEEKHRKLTRHFSGASGVKPVSVRVRAGRSSGRVLSLAASMSKRRRIIASPARSHDAISVYASSKLLATAIAKRQIASGPGR
jgi:hypothetical protein